MFSNKLKLRNFNAALGLLIFGMLLIMGTVQARDFEVYIFYMDNILEVPMENLTVEFRFMQDNEWGDWFLNEGQPNGAGIYLFAFDDAQNQIDKWTVRFPDTEATPVVPLLNPYYNIGHLTVFVEWEVEP